MLAGLILRCLISRNLTLEDQGPEGPVKMPDVKEPDVIIYDEEMPNVEKSLVLRSLMTRSLTARTCYQKVSCYDFKGVHVK